MLWISAFTLLVRGSEPDAVVDKLLVIISGTTQAVPMHLSRGFGLTHGRLKVFSLFQ